MANNEIKQKIVLEGEKQYRDAIKDAQRNLKTLRSELKAETAELGRNATEQQKNEAKVKSLQKQIKEQEKIVKANREALEEVRQKYGDNADAIAKYEQKLNDSRTALANMKNELGSVGQSFKQVETNAAQTTVATKSVADSLEKLSGIGDTISGSIESAFTGMIDTIRNAVGEVWELIAETAAKANNWTDLASVFSTTATSIQGFETAIEGIGGKGKFDSFVNLMTRLSYGGKEKKITELLGVSDVNYEDKLQYTMQVMRALQDYQKNHTRAQTDNVMTELFGAKKSADVTWLLNNWDDILDRREEYEEKGYTMDADEVETMNQVQLELNNIDEKWEMLKRKFASGFGQVTLDITAEISNGMDAIARYFNAKDDTERNLALHDLEESILGLFEVAQKAIEDGVALLDKVAEDLKASDNPTAQALGNILSGLVDALKWLTEDNMKNVVHALEILAAFWLTGKGLQMGAKIAAIVKDIAVIKAYNMGGGAAGTGNVITGGGAGGGSLLQKAGGKVAAFFGGPGGILTASAAAVFALGQYLEGKTYNRDWGQFNANEAAQTGEVVPNIIKLLHDAAVGLDTDDYGDRMELAKQLFLEHGNEFYQSNPELQFFRNGALASYLEDGQLTNEELQEILENDLVPVADDWEELMRDLYNIMSERYNNGDFTGTPSDWWQTNGGNTGNTDGLTTTDAKGMTDAVNKLPGEVKKSMLGMKVMMDRTVVGQMVADEVSRQIAGYIV